MACTGTPTSGTNFIKLFSPSFFCAIGFFNEADTLESSSILIYSELHASLYTKIIGRDDALIK